MTTEREFKFRAWDKREGLQRMLYLTGFLPYGEGWTGGNPAFKFYTLFFGDGGFSSMDVYTTVIMQYTGHKDSNNKEVYEGDIHRQENEYDTGDERYYMVCVWIKEWSMFGWLTVDEYHTYLAKGAESLDEFLFWSYTVERAGDITVCGNIFEHPNLIEL